MNNRWRLNLIAPPPNWGNSGIGPVKEADVQFRKKPVVIDAEQWFSAGPTMKGVHWERRSGDEGEELVPYVITAHEQRAYLAEGDWVIPEPMEGRYYPCKPDIFEATYDAVDPAPPMTAQQIKDFGG